MTRRPVLLVNHAMTRRCEGRHAGIEVGDDRCNAKRDATLVSFARSRRGRAATDIGAAAALQRGRTPYARSLPHHPEKRADAVELESFGARHAGSARGKGVRTFAAFVENQPNPGKDFR